MNAYLDPIKSPLRDRFDYLLSKPEAAVVLGDPWLQELSEPDFERKAYSYLVTFKESREELLRKLEHKGMAEQEFVLNLLRDLMPAYDPESLSVSVVGHSNTGHYHYHVTILNWEPVTNRALYIPGGEKQKRRHELVSRKWELVLDLDRGRKRLFSDGKPGLRRKFQEMARRGSFRAVERQAVREELTALAGELVARGVVSNRDELIGWLQKELGWKVNRKGDSYVGFSTPAGNIRLKGGVWSYEDFGRIANGLRREEEGIGRDKQAELERIQTELRELDEWFKRSVERRYAGSRSGGGTAASTGPEEAPNEDLQTAPNVAPGGIYTGSDGGLDGMEVEREQAQVGRQVFEGSGGVVQPQDWTVAGSQYRGGGLSVAGWKMRWEGEEMFRKAKEEWMEKRREEIELVKSLPPEIVLGKLGIPYKRVGSQLMALATWRGERHPSVSVQNIDGVWLWHDFGTDQGGSWIDLLMTIKGIGYVEAVRELRCWLREAEGWDWDLLHSQIQLETGYSSSAEITKIEPVSHPALIRYLKERGITHIPEWLREVHWERFDSYTGEKKRYFGLGVRNINGGWMIRNSVWKGTLGSGGPAVIDEPDPSGRIAVVEGLFDALALCQIGIAQKYVILGGTGNVVQAVPILYRMEPKEVMLALDNDEAGKQAAEYLLDRIDRAYTLDYGNYKDPAEALHKGHRSWKIVPIYSYRREEESRDLSENLTLKAF